MRKLGAPMKLLGSDLSRTRRPTTGAFEGSHRYGSEARMLLSAMLHLGDVRAFWSGSSSLPRGVDVVVEQARWRAEADVRVSQWQ